MPCERDGVCARATRAHHTLVQAGPDTSRGVARCERAAIANRHGLPAWTVADHKSHKRADRVAAASAGEVSLSPDW